MRTTTLTSLAILKVNWDERGHDHADNFVPFILEAIRLSPQPEISVSGIQKSIREEFGLLIPQGAINTLLRRAQRRGAITREHGIFVRSGDIENMEFQKARAEYECRQSTLIDKLVRFVNDRFGIAWTQADAESALLKHIQESCVPILAAAVAGSPIPKIGSNLPNATFIG